MEAKEGTGISYTWRSLVSGLRPMEKGMIWRVGDGEQIRICEAPWIPANTTRRPQTLKGLVLLSKVSELIDPIMGTWDSQLIRDIFWEEVVTNILSIPIRPACEYAIAWHFLFERNILIRKEFSVKSTNHVLEDNQELSRCSQRGESSIFKMAEC